MNLSRILCKNSLSTQLLCNFSTFNNTTRLRKSLKLIPLNRALVKLYPSVYYLHKAVTANDTSITKEETFIKRILKKIPFLNVQQNHLRLCGFLLYESIVDRINYANFFEEFALPDTFYSWFAVTELHIWMLCVRAMAEGDDGRIIRNAMVQALWTDVGIRIKKIGAVNSSAMKTHILELCEQFQAALIAYDEGLQTNDVVFAGALWRRLYQQKDVDPEYLDLLIKYIRKHMCLLEHVSRDDLTSQKPKITWENKT